MFNRDINVPKSVLGLSNRPCKVSNTLKALYLENNWAFSLPY